MKTSGRRSLAATVSVFLALGGFAHAELKPTRGPNGEAAVSAKTLALTHEQEANVATGKYTVALVWHENSEWTNAANQGAKDEFKRLGVEVIAETNAGFDAAKQKSDVETVMAKKPSAIFGEAVDPDTAAEAYRSAKEAGTVMVFVDQPPKGYVQGKDYVTIVSDDLKEMGHHAGDALAAAIGEKGSVAYVYHDANFFVTNQRDNNTKQTILDDHKNVKIVGELGLADPTKAEDVLNALILKHPDLDGIYATWSTPAEAILAALRNAGNKHTKIVTFDLSEPLAVDMVKGGNVAAIVADQPYQIGVTGARAVAMGLLKQQVKPYYAVEALTVTKDTIKQGYLDSQHRDPPPTVVGH